MTRETSFPDIFSLLSILLLLTMGLLANYSTSHAEASFESAHFFRQLIWIGLGLTGMVGALLLPSKFFQTISYIVYGFTVLALIAVLITGHTGMGATRWIAIGPFKFQPSEFAKVTTIMALAQFLSDNQRRLSNPWVTVMAIGMCLFPMGLILVEPDLGTSLVFPVLLFCMLAWAGTPALHLLMLLTPVAAVLTSWNSTAHYFGLIILMVAMYLSSKRFLPLVLAAIVFLSIGSATPKLWGKLHPYQQKRLTTFINPEEDPLGSAYQIIQSKIAIGSGQVTGKGFLQGTQTQLNFLPEGHTDFVFSAWAEEWGFLGSLFLVVLLLLLFFRGIQFASRCHNSYNGLIATGIVCTLAFQSLTNLLMTVGWLPVTGLPLPFISYGGSSLLTTLFMSGMLLGVSMRWRQY